MRTRALASATIFTLALLDHSVLAQSSDALRLDFSEPQIVLSPGGRTGACDHLRFDRAGKTLFAVGDDKVIHQWTVSGGELTPRSPLRWNVFREQRGAIYALAISPDEKLLAIGGYGRKNADVVVLDRQTGKVVRALSAETHRGYGTGGVVWSVAFDATGSRLAVGFEDGSLWVWGLAGNRGEAKLVKPGEQDRQVIAEQLARIIWTGFHGEAVRYAAISGIVGEVVPGQNHGELFRFEAPVGGVVAHPQGKWLASRPLRQTATGTTVEIRSLPDGELIQKIDYPKNERNEHRLLPSSLAVDTSGNRLAVASIFIAEETRFRPSRPGDIRIYDLRDTSPRLIAASYFDGHNGTPTSAPDAMAFAPHGEQLAVAGGLDHETSLWNIADGKLQPAGKRVVSVGRPIWQVGAAEDGKVICMRTQLDAKSTDPNALGMGNWDCFDLSRPGWSTRVTEPSEQALLSHEGWTVEISPTNEFSWEVVHKESGFHYPLLLEKSTVHRPMCYTFLPTGPRRRLQLAVGHYWGFTVYEFRRGDRPRIIVRGEGHHGPVTSIAPAKQGQLLLTGSTDQTVCLWVLTPWEHHARIGAGFDWRFDPKTGQRSFQVTAVQDGSPAWECGLHPGDRIRRLGYDVRWVENTNDWLDTLEQAEPRRELAFDIQRPSENAFVQTWAKTRLLTRPQARFFPALGSANKDWILYRYSDYYYAASPGGDAYLGWLVGGKMAADTPEYLPADQFRSVFARPDKVRQAVLELVRHPERPPLREYVPPDVEIHASDTKITDAPVQVTLKVHPRRDETNRPIPIEKVELWLDDEVLLQEWAISGEEGSQSVERTCKIRPEQVRIGSNRLTATGYAKVRGERTIRLQHTPMQTRAPIIRGLAVGIDTYPYLPAGSQLHSTVADARLVQTTIEGLATRGKIRSAKVDLLLEKQATPASILAGIDATARELGPDDWFILFLAGHGFAEGVTGTTGGRAVGDDTAPAAPGGWFFCGYAPWKGDPLNLSAVGGERGLVQGLRQVGGVVSASLLLDRLARLNCRKLVLIDSCHSGAIAQDPGRDLRPGGKGAVILAAAAPYETAQEALVPVPRNGRTVKETHGFFTAALAHTLNQIHNQTDRNRDGFLTLEELHQGVASQVIAMRQEMGLSRKGGPTQTVIAVPPAIRDHVFLTLASQK
ncbi:MAG: hypothetical protein LC104_13155 [Bacteroidales bacterium]|nr:hypothetical protein [Bacteroidales bacterium]